MLFMGEEWGATTPWQFFTSHEESLGELAAANRFKEFARMGWDQSLVSHPQDPATLERSKLDWAEPEKEGHAQILQLYRALARIRRERPELTDPRFNRTTVNYDESARWLLLDRSGVQVAFNFGDDENRVPFLANTPELLLGTESGVLIENFGMGACSVTLPPHSAAVMAG
jgi:maltooligosyltrehalose trehalohydrolase